MNQVDDRPIAGIGLCTAPLALRSGTDAKAVATVRAVRPASIRDSANSRGLTHDDLTELRCWT